MAVEKPVPWVIGTELNHHIATGWQNECVFSYGEWVKRKCGVGKSKTRLRATNLVKNIKVISIIFTSQVSRAAKQRTILSAVLSIPIFQDMHRVAVNVHEVGGVSLFTNCTDDKSDCHVITNVHYCSTFTTHCICSL